MDRFAGDWLVSEYVYNAAGKYLGRVHQRRRLIPGGAGLISVVQYCEIDAALTEHPMAGFAGEWRFEMSIEGRMRRYHGPDVIGTGLIWAEGVMLGRGFWPEFGHNFTSYAALIAPDRQVTGGVFSRAGEISAQIVGLAVPEGPDGGYPAFSGPETPQQLASHWVGSFQAAGADGRSAGAGQLRREYHGEGWRDSGDLHAEIVLSAAESGCALSGAIQGTARRYGPLLRLDGVSGPEGLVESISVFDAATRQIVEIRQDYRDHQLEKVQVIRLTC